MSNFITTGDIELEARSPVNLDLCTSIKTHYVTECNWYGITFGFGGSAKITWSFNDEETRDGVYDTLLKVVNCSSITNRNGEFIALSMR